MEEGVQAEARGEDQRELLGQFGLADGRLGRLDVVGQRVVAKGSHGRAEELDLAGSRGESGLAVGALHALLVLLVDDLALLAAGLGGVERRGNEGLPVEDIHAVQLVHAPEDHFLLIGPRPVLGVDALAPLEEELPVVPALARCLDGLLHGDDHVAVHLLVPRVALGPVGGGEDDVSQLSGRRHVEVLDDHEVEVGTRERLAREVGVLVAHDGVARDADEGLHGTRLAGDDGLKHRMRVVGAAERLVQRMLLAAEGEQVGASRILRRIPQRDLVVEHLVEGQRHLHAAGHVDVAEQALKARDGAAGLDGVGVHAGGAGEDGESGGAGRADEARALANVVGVKPAYLSRALGGPLSHAVGKLLESEAPLLDELLVVPFVLDDLVHEGKRERAVGAGAQLQRAVGHLREVGEARVDADELAAAVHRGVDGLGHRAHHGGVVAPDHNGPSVEQVAHAGVEQAEREGVGQDVRHEAHVRGRHRPALEPERGVQAAVPVVRGAARSLTGDDGLGAVLLLDAQALGGDGVHGLVPCDALPLARAARSDALHRVQDAVLEILVDLALGHARRADGAAGLRVLSVAFDLEDLVAVYGDDDAATRVAGHACAANLLHSHVFLLLSFPLLYPGRNVGSTPAGVP